MPELVKIRKVTGHNDPTKRKGRWYFGGLASAGAACCTHPLDLLKVHLQTQQKAELKLTGMAVKIVRTQGVLALYNGLTASLLRQLTYSMTRFGIYESVKNNFVEDPANMPFYQKVGLAAVAGFSGGVVGTPADMVNVRMQNDIKLPKEQRRNYKHAIDGLYRVYLERGVQGLFKGVTMASSRAVLMTVGQISFYDQIKVLLLTTKYFDDNVITHFSASTMAGGIATAMTQPLDVMKTRVMNAKPGQYKSLMHCAVDVAKNGPMGFFKGFVPAFVRLAPQTILTFLFFEQLRQRFGTDPPETKDN
ncbi:unnamed protein product [Owenia fusiformis]|uniref:Uncharacterized protein n=1 Tax=Owenia fusiformis TaxID=6347 RepID=A0A8J1UKE1_OWEFU|nr:unnamed protein product [Owenia fusiformis]